MNHYGLEQMVLGKKEAFTVKITEGMLDAFRKLSGDENPLHVDKQYAQSAGFEERVVYGMLTASFFSTLIGMYLPGEKALFQGADISFRAPVFPLQTLTVQGEITHVNEAFGQIEISANIFNEKGVKVCKALLKTGVRP
jgi:3-hydroxybutyryl-CoA dehydratase